MKRATHRHLTHIAQGFAAGGLGLALLWNLVELRFDLNWWGWAALMLPLPGLLGWAALFVGPRLRGSAIPRYPHAYRLLYSTPAGWDDNRVRQSLLTLIRSGIGLDIIWVREGTEVGCWLAVANDEGVLERLVRDMFPDGSLEAGHHAHRRRFAGPVGAQKAEHLAGLDPEAQVVAGAQPSVVLGQALTVDHVRIPRTRRTGQAPSAELNSA